MGALAEVHSLQGDGGELSEFPPRDARPTVLVVDDDNCEQGAIRRALSASGYDCREASGADEAIAAVSKGHVSVVLLGLNLGNEEGGFDVLRRLAPFQPEVAVVVVTGNQDVGIAERALSAGACAYLTKPFPLQNLRMTVLSALRAYPSRPHAFHVMRAQARWSIAT